MEETKHKMEQKLMWEKNKPQLWNLPKSSATVLLYSETHSAFNQSAWAECEVGQLVF